MKTKPSYKRTALVLAGMSWALVGSASGQVSISTEFGNGADTYLTNDGNSAPTVPHGTENGMEIREWTTVRMRHLYLRFDISAVAGDRTGATITVNGTAVNRSRPLNYIGVVDSPAAGNGASWDEATTTFATASGIDPLTPLSEQPLFTSDALLGTSGWGVAHTLGSAVGLNTTEPSADLDAMIAADTDGLITFIVTLIESNNNSEQFFFNPKESVGGGGIAPYITFPNASDVDTDMDGLGDSWEISNFGDLSQDGTGDPDGDGFDNEAEETAGSDPNNINSVPGDVDGDGLDDVWEDANFGDNDGIALSTELALQDGAGDPDNDKCTNEEEETAGTNPNDRNSFIDTDADGVNDCWEIYYAGDLITITATTDDGDGDGEDAATEYANFSDPTNILSVMGDIDGDGVPDLWEDQYYGNNDGIVNDSVAGLAELSGTDGTGDPDGDGFTDLQESNATPVPSNPNNANSVPGDADGDGVDDNYELTEFGDIFLWNGLHDPDGDLYTNEEEETAGTSASDIYSFPDDVDADGMNDRWEIKYFGDIATDNDQFGDPDGDLFDNDFEYSEWNQVDGRSDPTNVLSTPDDKDGDGLDDLGFERIYWANIHEYDGDDDPDRDYSTNEEEESDPGVPDPTNRTSSPDSDADTLGDGWEMFSFGDLVTTDLGTDDNDMDLVDNTTEYGAATNGNDPLSGPDTDNDGLPDVYELSIWGDITTQTGWDDSDGGGTNNQLECQLGTDPTAGGDDPTPPALTTAIGKGADTFITNDNAGTTPQAVHGAENGFTMRTFYGVRMRVPVLRFDVSTLSGDLSGTRLQFYNSTVYPRTRSWIIWGLVDGDADENWDEGTLNYSGSPGCFAADLLDGAGNAQFPRDPQRLRRLGTMQVYQNTTGFTVSDPATLDLESFIQQDTDGVITLLMSNGDENFEWYVWSKEGAAGAGEPARAPSLIVPNGVVTIPTPPEITDFGFVGNNPANDFYIDVADGVAGKKVTSSDNLADPFTDVPTTDDGVNRFLISPANRNALKDFFRVEN